MIGALLASTTLVSAQALTDERRAELEANLRELEKQIEVQRQLLANKQGERVTLERDISILEAQIAKAKLSIQARDLEVRKLTGEIGVRNETIGELNEKLEREKQSLAQIIRNTNHIDDVSMVEIILSNQTISEFFEDLDDYEAVKAALQVSFDEIATTKGRTQAEKQTLEEKRKEEEELRRLQELERQEIAARQDEKEDILTVTKGQESTYQNLLTQTEQTAAQIRAALFSFADGGQIPLPTAIALAKQTGAATGIRPAFILGILKQETNIGANVGNGNWKVDMHPSRDVPIFAVIAKTLGINPDTQPVSRAPSYGYGGAMGPSQFIPSTWACYGGYVNSSTGGCGKNPDGTYSGPWEYNSSQDRIARAAGHSNTPSNPWNNLDAFTATALYMADLGAGAKTFAAEREAALRYFAGGNYSNPAYAFYGDSVMQHAAGFEEQIRILDEDS